MEYLTFLGFLPWTMYIIFCGIMALKRVQSDGKLNRWMVLLGGPWLIIGYILDFLLNVFWGSAIFKEFPKELTFSSRLWRWSNQTDDLPRQRRALRYRQNLLDPIDPDGIHKG